LNKERISKYVEIVEYIVEDLEKRYKLEGKTEEIFKLAKAYVKDSKYYLETGDIETSGLCIAYAEGLLDALRIQGVIDFEWPKKVPREKPKVLIGGTFDILHPGHVYLISEAAKLGKVYVIVSRDSTVKKVKNREPINDETQRLFMIKHVKGVYEALLGDKHDMYKSVLKVKPDIIVLGPDQKFNEDELKRELKKRGLENIKIVRVKEKMTAFKHNSTTGIIEEIVRRYCK